MTRSKREIDEFFKEYVFGFIWNDVAAVIAGAANYSAALCLLSYTEYLGGLIDGSLGISSPGMSSKRFKKALEYFAWNGDPNYYKDFKVQFRDLDFQEKDGDLYGLFRCGLAHEYFIKADSFVHNNANGICLADDAGVQVIEDNGQKRLRFHTNAYFRDFRDACQRYHKDLVQRQDADLLRNFCNALDRMSVREIRF